MKTAAYEPGRLNHAPPLVTAIKKTSNHQKYKSWKTCADEASNLHSAE